MLHLQNGERYHSLDGYSQSMFANILFAKSLAQICADESIAVFSANPGSKEWPFIYDHVLTYFWRPKLIAFRHQNQRTNVCLT